MQISSEDLNTTIIKHKRKGSRFDASLYSLGKAIAYAILKEHKKALSSLRL